MPEIRRQVSKHLKHLRPLYTKFRDLPAIKFQEVLPSTVINAMDGTFDLTSPLIKEVWDYMGSKPVDYPVAVRVAKLQTQYPAAPKTELITYDWLRAGGYTFVYQAALFGGRAQLGGILPDMLVADGGEWNAWPIQGDYWHSYKVNQGQDQAEKIRLIGQTFSGRRITKVTQVWETHIRYRRPEVFMLALQGIELQI